jgi:hypothetical protein
VICQVKLDEEKSKDAGSAVPVSALWVALQKSKEVNLDVKNIFAESHT